jgi:hypothetical protein
MPRSNKRTASLPSPHPIDLQSRCSALPGSPLLRLYWAPASCQIHAQGGSPPLGLVVPQLHARSTPARIPTPWAPTLRPCWAPALPGTTRSMPCWDLNYLGPAGSLPLCIPSPQGQAPAPWDSRIPQPTRIPAPWVEPGPSSAGFQIITPPGSSLGHHRRAPNLPKRHTQTGLDAKGVTSEQLRLQFYCSRTGDFFFSFFKGLVVWFAVWSPTISPIFFSLFSPPFIFPSHFLSFFLGFISINIVNQLILNYT